jgi:hypothetical protein
VTFKELASSGTALIEVGRRSTRRRWKAAPVARRRSSGSSPEGRIPDQARLLRLHAHLSVTAAQVGKLHAVSAVTPGYPAWMPEE